MYFCFAQGDRLWFFGEKSILLAVDTKTLTVSITFDASIYIPPNYAGQYRLSGSDAVMLTGNRSIVIFELPDDLHTYVKMIDRIPLPGIPWSVAVHEVMAFRRRGNLVWLAQ